MTRLTIIPLIFVLLGNVGCNSGRWLLGPTVTPTTSLRLNPLTKSFSFEDSKNNNVSIVGLRFNKANGEFEIESLNIINNSSEVIAADTERLKLIQGLAEANVDLHRQIGTNLALLVAAGGDAVSDFVSKLPNLNLGIDTPIGSGTLGITQPVGPPAPATTTPTEVTPTDTDGG